MSTIERDEQAPGVATFDELSRLLEPVMRAVAAAVGPYCEVVLHDLSHGDLDRSIAKIENGHVTGRMVGGPSTNRGLELLASDEAEPAADSFGYTAFAADGKQLRCSSVYYYGEKGALLGALCVNVDLTQFQVVQQAVTRLLGDPDVKPGPVGAGEIFASDVDGLLETLLESAIQATGVAAPMMNKEDRIKVFETLDKRGAFFIKHSVPKVAKRLGVSRVTAYSYLDEARQRLSEND